MRDISFTPTFFNRDEDKFVEDETTEVIPFQLTDDEILKIAKETAELQNEFKKVDSKFTEIKKDYKGKLNGIESDMNYNFKLIADQVEDREVDCIRRKNFSRKIVQFIHNGVVMKERPMMDHEMTHPDFVQASLNGGSHHSL